LIMLYPPGTTGPRTPLPTKTSRSTLVPLLLLLLPVPATSTPRRWVASLNKLGPSIRPLAVSCSGTPRRPMVSSCFGHELSRAGADAYSSGYLANGRFDQQIKKALGGSTGSPATTPPTNPPTTTKPPSGPTTTTKPPSGPTTTTPPHTGGCGSAAAWVSTKAVSNSSFCR